MSPANNWHGLLQARLVKILTTALPNGEVITECSVLTEIGIRVPDLIWASHEFLAAQGDVTPFTRAPEICVGVLSRWNTKREIDEKVKAYLAAGARESWVVDEQGEIRYFGPEGQRVSSEFGVTVELPKRRKDVA
jgi:Uma2 family endonuclease